MPYSIYKLTPFTKMEKVLVKGDEMLFVHSAEFRSHMTHKSNCFKKKIFTSKLFAHENLQTSEPLIRLFGLSTQAVASRR